MKKFVCVVFYVVVLIAVAVSTAGCATIADAQRDKGEGGAGTIKTYSASYDQVWDAVIQIVQNSVLDLVSHNKQTGEILAQRSATLFSWGENVAIYISKVEPDGSRTTVEVISKRALSTNITAKNWESHIFNKLDSIEWERSQRPEEI